jgi:hypothetical protein
MRNSKVNLWKNLPKGPFRRANGTWKLSNAARWFANLVDWPIGSIVFVHPDGKTADPNSTLADLRQSWGE